MNQIQFVGTTPTELVNQLRETIEQVFTAHLNQQPTKTTAPAEYLTTAQVCELLQVNASTLHRWRKKNVLTAYQIEGKVFFKRSQIEEYINNNKLLS